MSEFYQMFLKIIIKVIMTLFYILPYLNSAEPEELKKYYDHYDARTTHSNCVTISTIRNQSNCGSCWAIAVASAFSDRLCIHSKGAINYEMSAGQLLSCDTEAKGCWGGSLYWAWKYIEENGLVTGGAYGEEGCFPYPIKPTRIYWYWMLASTPKCPDIQCQITHKAKEIRELPNDEYKIRQEILKNGPVSAAMNLYLSFFFYTEGMYTKWIVDIPMLSHAVRIIGWGETDNQKYWIIANSFGTDWGENGTFKMLRGENYLGIEENVTAGLPVI